MKSAPLQTARFSEQEVSYVRSTSPREPEGTPFALKVPISWNRLGYNALRVAIAVASFASSKRENRGQCRVSRQKIAERARVSPRAVTKSIAELHKAGVIEVVRTGRTSRYTLLSMANDYPDRLDNDHPVGSEDPIHSDQISADRSTEVSSRKYLSVSLVSNRTERRRERQREDDDFEPCQATIEALRPFLGGDYVLAQREGRHLLRSLGRERETLLWHVLSDPRTARARNPIGYALKIARNGGFKPNAS